MAGVCLTIAIVEIFSLMVASSRSRRPALSAARIALATVLAGSMASLAVAKKPTLPGSGIFAVDVGLSSIDGVVAAFGDFNGDKLMDVFVLDSRAHTVSVHIWNRKAYSFERLPNATLSLDLNRPSKYIIDNVIPADFNLDGRLDVLLVGEDSKRWYPEELELAVYLGNGKDGFNTTAVPLPSSSTAQPFMVDFFGRMEPGLLGVSAANKTLTHWSFLSNPTATPVQLRNSTSGEHACQISDPHSSGFADFNGDCLADILLYCHDSKTKTTRVETWINQKSGPYTPGDHLTLPEGSGQIALADIDADGTIDLIYPSCLSKGNCFINIAYNKQKPLCKSTTATSCRSIDQLCSPDDDFSFELSSGLPISEFLPQDERLQLGLDGLPLPIRIGDFNNDGFPDLLVITTSASGSHLRLLQSIPCGKTVCTVRDLFRGRRAFTPVMSGTEDLNKESGKIIRAAFFDVDEDGTLDIVVSRENELRQWNSVYLNNFYNDAFFLKALVLNGVCPNCKDQPAIQKPYGVNYVGASIKYTVTDTSGQIRSTQVVQMPQTAYGSLQTPYTLFGLGRTNNYIEMLVVGVSRNQSNSIATYQGVIPNSQLIIVPYQPSGVEDSSTWRLELFVNPSGYAAFVLLTLCICALVLSIIVAGLYVVERREDELEKRTLIHAINFDAL
ncbi:hypothetical protein DFJ73DRAFT_826194 [Zopfochytrium polystomum]|nr:hypothetical protein DFJ73DRAFT_826194 [Zopfochytrium polystomum]